MSFVDELYNQNKEVHESIWIQEVYGILESVKSVVRSEHNKGTRHFKGYCTWYDGDCYIEEEKSMFCFGGVLGSDYPLEKNAKKLNEELKKAGFINSKVYCDNVTRHETTETRIFRKTKFVPKETERTVWIEVSW